MKIDETKQIKAVIFDMDGVLLDSESVCDRCFEQAAIEQNIEDRKPIIEDARGMGKPSFMDFIAKTYGDKIDTELLWNRASELFHIVEDKEGLSLLPFVKEILEYLKPNYKIALASSTRRSSVERQMKATGIWDFFDVTVCGDDVQNTKPSPEIYQKAVKDLNLLPENCLAIEDSLNGIKSGTSAGLKVIMVPDQVKPNDQIKSLVWKIFDSLGELKSIL
jgi:HAD superfamily hydrolase (TIGR01509 family)